MCYVYPNVSEEDCMVLYESMPRRIAFVSKKSVVDQIIKDFVENFKKIQYLYIVLYLDLYHIFLLLL